MIVFRSQSLMYQYLKGAVLFSGATVAPRNELFSAMARSPHASTKGVLLKRNIQQIEFKVLSFLIMECVFVSHVNK